LCLHFDTDDQNLHSEALQRLW